MTHDITAEETAHVKWVEEMQSLRWNNTDRSEILDMLLETYDLAWVDAIEDILNSPQAEDMKHLINAVKNRREDIVNG
jgi:hypothetical protein